MADRENGLMERMIIDCEKIAGFIINFIREKVKEQKKDGVLLGLSGGVDSATMATLATFAIGPKKVWAFYLPDRDSEIKFLRRAQKIVDKLGANFKLRNITKTVRQEDIYKSLMMRLAPLSRILNKLMIFISNRLIYPLFFKESGFVLALKQGEPAKNRIKKIINNTLAAAVDKSFTVRHIQRRKILEKFAEENNLLLIGAANRSESFVGWFVKDGVDDLPLEPLLGLYKNQVQQLAKFLDVPAEIVEQPPSPDMLKGVGDEDIIGFPYEKIDKVAYILEHGLNHELALNDGVSPREFDGIKKLHQLSAWKRNNNYEFPNVEAGSELIDPAFCFRIKMVWIF